MESRRKQIPESSNLGTFKFALPFLVPSSSSGVSQQPQPSFQQKTKKKVHDIPSITLEQPKSDVYPHPYDLYEQEELLSQFKKDPLTQQKKKKKKKVHKQPKPKITPHDSYEQEDLSSEFKPESSETSTDFPILLKEIPGPTPIISHDLIPGEWTALNDYIINGGKSWKEEVPGSLFMDRGNTSKDLETFILYYISEKVGRNVSPFNIFLSFMHNSIHLAKYDSSKKILNFLDFMGDFYENKPFNALMMNVIGETGEYDFLFTNEMSHHKILITRDTTQRADSSYGMTYHHFAQDIANQMTLDDSKRSLFITFLKIVVGMSEIFNQLHLFHLRVQNALTSRLYFGSNDFSPTDKLLVGYHLMAVIAKFNGNYSIGNLETFIKLIELHKKNPTDVNNDIEYRLPLKKYEEKDSEKEMAQFKDVLIESMDIVVNMMRQFML